MSQNALLDDVEQLAGNIKPELRIQFAHAGRRCDVDLGQVIADDIQANEQQAAPTQLGSHLIDDPPVSIGQRQAFATTTRSKIAAKLVALRNARQRIRHRFAVDYQDALVAGGDLRNVLLRDGQLPTFAVRAAGDGPFCAQVYGRPFTRGLPHSRAMYSFIGVPMGLVIASIHEKRDEFRKLLVAAGASERTRSVRRPKKG